jgi:hypothetical protein
MAFLFKQLRTKAKQISDFDSLSVGFDRDRETVRISLHDHFVEVTDQDIAFLVKQLPLAKMRLLNAQIKKG